VGGSKRWVDWITPPDHRGAQVVAGYLLMTVAFLLGISLIFLLAMLRDPQRGGHDPCVMGLLGGAGTLLYSLFRYARRLRAPHALRALKRDARAPILLLRAFRQDFQELQGFTTQGAALTFGAGGTRSFEEYLCRLLSQCGPVIAVGRPGERVSPLGASRFWVQDHRWKQVVDELLQESQYVVMVMGSLGTLPGAAGPGTSREATPHEDARAPAESSPTADDGLTWEVKRLFGLKECDKVILIVPPVDEGQAAHIWLQYQELSLGRLPPYYGGEVAATFEADGICRVVRVAKSGWFTKTYRRDLSAYESCIDCVG